MKSSRPTHGMASYQFILYTIQAYGKLLVSMMMALMKMIGLGKDLTKFYW